MMLPVSAAAALIRANHPHHVVVAPDLLPRRASRFCDPLLHKPVIHNDADQPQRIIEGRCRPPFALWKD